MPSARVNWQTGKFEGYAWSDDVGWVAFGDVSHNNPNGAVSVNTSTGRVTGKARVIATGANIVFDDPSTVYISTTTGVMSGWAFSQDIGWLKFDNPGVNIVNFSTDLTEPTTNASGITMSSAASGGYAVTSGGWEKRQYSVIFLDCGRGQRRRFRNTGILSISGNRPKRRPRQLGFAKRKRWHADQFSRYDCGNRLSLFNDSYEP